MFGKCFKSRFTIWAMLIEWSHVITTIGGDQKVFIDTKFAGGFSSLYKPVGDRILHLLSQHYVWRSRLWLRQKNEIAFAASIAINYNAQFLVSGQFRTNFRWSYDQIRCRKFGRNIFCYLALLLWQVETCRKKRERTDRSVFFSRFLFHWLRVNSRLRISWSVFALLRLTLRLTLNLTLTGLRGMWACELVPIPRKSARAQCKRTEMGLK